MPTNKEQRNFYRWIKSLIISYADPHNEQVTKLAATENISEGGLQVFLAQELKKDLLVEIKIELVFDSIPIIATCKVVFVSCEKDRFRTGLQFVKIEDFQKERLLRYLKEEGR